MIKLTQWVTHTIEWLEIELSPHKNNTHFIELSSKHIPYCKTTCHKKVQRQFSPHYELQYEVPVFHERDLVSVLAPVKN